MKFFQHKKVVVTGAANGLGKAFVKQLLDCGGEVLAVDVDESALNLLVTECTDHSHRLYCLNADISSRDHVQHLKDMLPATFQHIDILINNAGVSHQGSIGDMEVGDFEWVVKTNLLGTFYCTKALLPYLAKSPKGAIVNIISGIVFHVLPGFAAYGASKAAIRGLSQSLRAELRPQGIDVFSVYPGPIKTNIPLRSRHTAKMLKEKELNYLHNRGYDPSHCARITLRSIARGKQEIRLGWEVNLGFWVSRFFPSLLSYYINRRGNILPL